MASKSKKDYTAWIWGLVLVALVVAVYQPVWFGDFIWDDDAVIGTNHAVTAPGGIVEAWTSASADICPLTISTFWLEYRLFGPNAAAFHIVTILLHAAGAVVLWRLLRRLGSPAAWFGAALWALHPVQAESVAWIAETKNTESGVFFLLSILFFLRWLDLRDEDGKLRLNRQYALMLVFGVLAMASKSSTVILPLVLWLCAWWKEPKAAWRPVLWASPLLGASGAFAAVSVWTQQLQTQATGDLLSSRPLLERIAEAGYAVWFYLGKLVWPRPLIAIYPTWRADPADSFSYIPLAAAIIVLAVLLCLRTAWSRPCLFAFVYFIVALLPALGLLDNFIFYYALVFDHFQYLASIGPLALVAAGLGAAAQRWIPEQIAISGGWAGAMLLVVGMLTFDRAHVFHDEASIWQDTVEQNPDSWLAQSNYAQSLVNRGRFEDAVPHFEAALRIHETSPETQYNYGVGLLTTGKPADAVPHLRKAVDLYPNFAEAHETLANALLELRQPDAAIGEFQQALALRPDLSVSHYGWGMALVQKSDMAGAAEQFRLAVNLKPESSEYHNNLGAALYQMGKIPEATAEFQTALHLDPNNANAQRNLAKAQARAKGN